MSNHQSELFGRITEDLSESELSFDDRRLVYEILLEAFLDFNTKSLDEWQNIDPAFDEIYQEKYPEMKSEEDEE